MSESDSAKLAAVAWIHEQMDRHALTLDDLVAAGCFDKVPAPAVESSRKAAPETGADVVSAKTNGAPRPLYRNALGQSWDGVGEYPDWLQRAVNAGQSIEFFRVE
ncbi:H-NS family nucleoid-associated regulatory protein [Cupriavidus consociatus]|uniref:H-NS family nucleoid-associated regulatory protein n=1 Tax=Cupriavidus consociatus TaxID=2821357 RepID=UPI001AE74EC7|nr:MULTISPECIES: H-NS family nucleoid-associated regulatory protein [unclassified Cupriavidus]MBP0618951.1 H-NS histone family protein [Cupriavidus sp. LEh25]MDK2655596.1 H-NS family nucleoid-associated regulatory protein [Cupriavidus sp. LEh21]